MSSEVVALDDQRKFNMTCHRVTTQIIKIIAFLTFQYVSMYNITGTYTIYMRNFHRSYKYYYIYMVCDELVMQESLFCKQVYSKCKREIHI